MKKTKDYEDLTITDDFMFGKVMQDKNICKHLLELILNKKIKDITYPNNQQTINITAQGKSIRMDVYLNDDEGTIYNVEMQTTNQHDLSKRARYYQDMSDLNCINKGDKYKDLRDTYIIFICTFDPIGMGESIYEYENRLVSNPIIPLNDGVKKIFLNPLGNTKNIPEDLKAFLKYIINGEIGNNSFIQDMDKKICAVKLQKDWRAEYKMYNLLIEEAKEAAREEGKAEGKAEGRAEGKLDNLIELFLEGIISKQVAIEKSGLTEKEFDKMSNS